MLAATPPRRALSRYFERVFVINLDRRPDRWRAFQEQYARSAGADELRWVERVPAVDGSTVDLQALHHQAGVLSALGLRRLCEPPENRVWGMDLSPGAVGCALSHVLLWARIAACAAPPDAERAFLILEDDCVFPPLSNGDFAALCAARLREVPRDGWGLLYLSGLDTARQCAALRVARGVCRVPQYHRTTNAYAVTPSGARALLRVCLPLTYQLDTMMTMNVRGGADGNGRVPYVQEPASYTLMPPLLVQSALVTGDIQDGEGMRSAAERATEDHARRAAAGWAAEAASPLL